jgi:serine/threonine protein kinase
VIKPPKLRTPTLERPAEEQQAFLEEACAGDTELRLRVERLLEAHLRPDSLSEPAAPGSATSAYDPPAGVEAGTVIAGRYKLLEEIGEGGMGTVWMAEQTEPVQRRVAVKLIKPGMDSRQVVARFEAERQALALMDHPNIAKVFDGGMISDWRLPIGDLKSEMTNPQSAIGRPFFVMELVKGTPITRYCDEKGVS